MSGHPSYIRRAIDLARLAREHGNHPFGALLVADDLIVLEAENTVVSQGNPTQHAEMNLVQCAWRTLPAELIRRSTLYTSTNLAPCARGPSSGRGYARWSSLCPPRTSGKCPVTGSVGPAKPCSIEPTRGPRSLVPSWPKRAGKCTGDSGPRGRTEDPSTMAVAARLQSARRDATGGQRRARDRLAETPPEAGAPAGTPAAHSPSMEPRVQRES